MPSSCPPGPTVGVAPPAEPPPRQATSATLRAPGKFGPMMAAAATAITTVLKTPAPARDEAARLRGPTPPSGQAIRRSRVSSRLLAEAARYQQHDAAIAPRPTTRQLEVPT